MQAIVETVFDIVYLCTVITLGLIMIRQGRGHRQYVLFGIMAVTLGAGDAFHLVPRVGKLYVRAGGRKIHHLDHDDNFLCFIILCLASALSGVRKAGRDDRRLSVGGAADCAVPVPAERLDQRQRSAILGDLPQYSVCPAGDLDHRVVLSKHEAASGRSFPFHEPDDSSQLWFLHSGRVVGGYDSADRHVDDSEDLRLCLDGLDRIFRDAQRTSNKIKIDGKNNANSRSLKKSRPRLF